MRPCTLYSSVARRLIFCAMVVSLGGCGFQLRGAPPVSSALEPLELVCQEPVPTSLCLSVREQLELGDVVLASGSEAEYRLRIRNFAKDRRASAITVQASAAEYTLRHSVNIELISADEVPVIADTRITTTESYRYDETSVLAKQREEENLENQLNSRLAQQIIFRLAPITEDRLREIRRNHQNPETATDTDPTASPQPESP